MDGRANTQLTKRFCCHVDRLGSNVYNAEDNQGPLDKYTQYRMAFTDNTCYTGYKLICPWTTEMTQLELSGSEYDTCPIISDAAVNSGTKKYFPMVLAQMAFAQWFSRCFEESPAA